MCGFPYVYRCTYTYVCRCVKVKVTVRCQSSGVIHLVLQDIDFPWGLGFASEARLDGQGARCSRDSVAVSPVQELQVHATSPAFKTWVLGIDPRSSCLPGKHLIE